MLTLNACYNLIRMESPLLQSLFDEEERRPMSVSELNSEVKAAVESRFASVWVEGEITNFHAATSGHWYFSLSDGDSILKAACFKGQNFRIRFKPFNGLQVRVRGKITIYEKRGEYQLMVESLEPVGEGALTVAFEQIKANLAKEGLFAAELKRPLPTFPRKIGIVTSPKGAAVHDIVTVLERRARSVSIVIIPTLVQGEFAGGQIVEAISLANQFNATADTTEKIDVLIVGRGGGSAEDLWAFNEEHVARAIRASSIPIISAVGHEIDFTIADFVADLRAATPSAAAEIVAAREADIVENLRRQTSDLTRLLSYRLLEARTELQSLALAPVFAEFPAKIRVLNHRVDDLCHRFMYTTIARLGKASDQVTDAFTRLTPFKLSAIVSENMRRLALLDQRTSSVGATFTESRHQELQIIMAKLDALSPLSVLDRGFSITQNGEGKILRDAAETQKGDILKIRLARGKLEAEVLASEDGLIR
ncbi:MAG: exodeoxyribonuclease VII large subunit [Blastocatellia bacterium]